MKIIGGIHKGRRLKSPDDSFVRPTLAKIREAFFDIVGQDIQNAAFLDMYAGTGAIGIEALSRGAHKVYFIERSKAVSTLLSKNLAFMDSNLYVVIMMDVMRAMEQIEKKNIKFDIAYVDPPYKDVYAYTDILSDMLNRKIMKDSFIIGIEHDRTVRNILQGVNLDMTMKTYRYGDTYLTIARRH
jgi:16S rRNA (guanine(966)-N(2))-methyltransferase RsmD